MDDETFLLFFSLLLRLLFLGIGMKMGVLQVQPTTLDWAIHSTDGGDKVFDRAYRIVSHARPPLVTMIMTTMAIRFFSLFPFSFFILTQHRQ